MGSMSSVSRYCPNLDTTRFSAPAPEDTTAFARRPGELILGRLAPPRPEKNIARLLRVLAKIDKTLPVRLVIAGAGVERNALEQWAHQLDIEIHVVFTGHASPESVPGHLDILALFSDTEQRPVALLEAMAARLPVATVYVGDVKTMVSQKNERFVAMRDDKSAFVTAIERLLHEPATRERPGDRNRERVAAEFSQKRMFDRCTELFLGHLADKRHRDKKRRYSP